LKRAALGAAAALIVALPALLVLLAPAATAEPIVAGLNVTTTRIYRDTSFILTQNIVVGAGGTLILDNVSIRDNGQNGVSATGGSASAPARVTVKNSSVQGNGAAAVLAADYSDAIVDSSTLTVNAQGVACVTQADGNCKVTASSNVINQNTTGVLSGRGVVTATGAATVYLTDNKIVANAKGLSLTTAPAHGTLVSLGDNTVVGNTAKGTTPATAAKI